ncbi:MAG TPA: OB-fold domain-containing protein [Candidatus Binataceae bacterium]|nr:OB-fold domain-containing protein [Candidatus Binataceae bacterium]
MSEARAKPVPLADELSAPFWAAAREGRLVVQRCVCGYYNHPPRQVCDQCLSQELKFVPVSGRGKIYSFTIMHQRDVAGFESEAPFLNLVVELDAQPMLLMVANLPAAERDRVRIGAPVEVQFEDRGGGAVIPQFRLAD